MPDSLVASYRSQLSIRRSREERVAKSLSGGCVLRYRSLGVQQRAVRGDQAWWRRLAKRACDWTRRRAWNGAPLVSGVPLLAFFVMPIAVFLVVAIFVTVFVLMDFSTGVATSALRWLFLSLCAGTVTLTCVVCGRHLVHNSRQLRRLQAELWFRNRMLIREIGRRQRVDVALRQAVEQAKRTNEAKTRYLRTMSHELRTPLNSIMGYADLLWQDPRIPSHRKQAIKTIQQSSDHLLSVVENSLDMASIESGHLKLLSHPFGFHVLLEQLVHMFALQARGKALHFQFEADQALPLQVKGDEQRVRQILINLLGNAIKFTERGIVRLWVRYQNGVAVFLIRDSGIGIADEHLPRVFEPFVARGDVQFSGTGLGLGISKMLAECMGGSLVLSSVVGVGTCVEVRLPLSLCSAQQEVLALPQFRQRLAYVGGHRTVLLLDDARFDYAWVVDRLTGMGFQIIVQQAESFGKGPADGVDVVLLNGDLPDRMAWHVLRSVRQWALTVPVAVLSVYVGENDRRQTEIHWTGVRFFQKPLRFEMLLDWLGEQLHLEWVSEAGLVEGYGDAPLLLPPLERQCRELRERIELGHTRGIVEKLDEIETNGVQYAGFVRIMRGFLQNFAFDAMKRMLVDVCPGGEMSGRE